MCLTHSGVGEGDKILKKTDIVEFCGTVIKNKPHVQTGKCCVLTSRAGLIGMSHMESIGPCAWNVLTLFTPLLPTA